MSRVYNIQAGMYIWTTPFWVAVVQQFLIWLSSSFFEKKEGVVQFQTRFLYYMEMSKTGDVLFLEHRKSVLLASDSDSPSHLP